MKSDIEVVELDMRGQICPSCLLLALKQVNAHQAAIKQSQKELHVLTDNRQSTMTIPDAVSKMGYRVDVDKQGGSYRIRIYSPDQAGGAKE